MSKENYNEINYMDKDGKVKTLHLEYEQKKSVDEIRRVKDMGDYVSGKVTGTKKLTEQGPVIASLFAGDYKVVIPFDKFIDNDFVGSNRNLGSDLFILERRLGSYIDYKVITIDDESKMIVGDRVAALKDKREDFWFRKNGNGDYKLKEGSIVEARIVTVSDRWLIVEVFGVEKRLNAFDVSHIRVFDLAAKYSPGDTTLVKITSLVRDEDTKEVDANFSMKDVRPDPIKSKIDNFSVGDIYIGMVTMTDNNGAYVELDGEVEVLCSIPKHLRFPIPGSRVSVVITNINEERFRMFGTISNVESVFAE